MSCDTPSNCVFLLPYRCTGAQAAVFASNPLQVQWTGVVSVRRSPVNLMCMSLDKSLGGCKMRRRGGKKKKILTKVKTDIFVCTHIISRYSGAPKLGSPVTKMFGILNVTRLFEKPLELQLKSVLHSKFLRYPMRWCIQVKL